MQALTTLVKRSFSLSSKWPAPMCPQVLSTLEKEHERTLNPSIRIPARKAVMRGSEVWMAEEVDPKRPTNSSKL